ncbi:hypothetical protein B7494_g3021 [Chlorociboria aeruginascens]|nr:hypothetical protein B7494_g3021 [Chlorociboria aeruginascens]
MAPKSANMSLDAQAIISISLQAVARKTIIIMLDQDDLITQPPVPQRSIWEWRVRITDWICGLPSLLGSTLPATSQFASSHTTLKSFSQGDITFMTLAVVGLGLLTAGWIFFSQKQRGML